MAGSQDISVFFWLGTCAMLSFVLALIVVVLSYQRHFFKVKRRETSLLLETAFASELKERQRIANDLHDGVQSDLSAVRMQLFRLKKNPGNPEILEDVDEAIVAAIENTRLISHNLMPPLLSRHGLLHTVRSHFEKLTVESGVIFEVHSESDFEFAIPTAYALYRVIQEFSSNMIKHGLVGKCTVNLVAQGDSLNVEIDDDGPAYDFEAAYRESRGMGLKNIRSRLDTIGAEMHQQKRLAGNRFTITLKTTRC